MDTRECDREKLRHIFQQWQYWPGPEAKFQIIPVMDYENDHYLLLDMGWNGFKRIHGLLVHVDIIDDKFWIQKDNTEQGIATELVAAGVPHERIVLAFQSPSMRQYGDFAVA